MINNFRDKIQDISNNNSINLSNKTFVGVVRSTNESSNLCSVDISTQFGEVSTFNMIPVTIDTGSGTIGWFPKAGDKVLLNCYNGSYEITAPCPSSYAKSYKHNVDTKDNLLTDFYNYTIGGNIF